MAVAIHTATLSEEVRHAIDLRHEKLSFGESQRPSLQEVTQSLFTEDGVIAKGFLGDDFPEDPAKVQMLRAALHEVTGKLSGIAMGQDPKVCLNNIQYDLELSRIKSQRVQTFSDDLRSAESSQGLTDYADEGYHSWQHAMAAKIIASLFAKQIGRDHIEEPGLQVTYDHVELARVLSRVEHLKPQEIRKMIKSISDQEFTIPIDCKPFWRIDEDGFMHPHEVSSDQNNGQ